ncbi:hypothetical protein R8Z50_35225 [Longispora sp. K20-0274]|uniref:hypothetical protein n=1 Tax=Longispora sp. K20-0274 TaxID=3088255 RepID=UPI00399A5A7B
MTTHATVELSVGVNEASDLLTVRSPEVLAAHGWTAALWTVLDEGPVEESIALLGRAPDGTWSTRLLPADAGAEAGRTEDSESLAYRDGYVYVLGSHFGSKRGPLQPRRAFAARFREADAAGPAPVRLEVARNRFRLHRAINDALSGAGVDPLRPGSAVHRQFIVETLERGAERGKKWITRIVEGDLPVNIEGAAFTPSGSLLLGLRFPVTADGAPIVVELADAGDLFDGSEPKVAAVHVLDAAEEGALTGIRALSARPDGSFDAVVGSIDAMGKESVLLDDHPHGGGVPCRHLRFRLPDADTFVIRPEVVGPINGFHNVEGVAELDGRPVYVTDDDHRVALWF